MTSEQSAGLLDRVVNIHHELPEVESKGAGPRTDKALFVKVVRAVLSLANRMVLMCFCVCSLSLVILWVQVNQDHWNQDLRRSKRLEMWSVLLRTFAQVCVTRAGCSPSLHGCRCALATRSRR
jgi:hypothetical protein